MAEKRVRIGGASGAWGDSPGAIDQLLGAGVNYLMMDYLAEVTMSLLARARMKDPSAGYAADAVAYLEPALPAIAQTEGADRLERRRRQSGRLQARPRGDYCQARPRLAGSDRRGRRRHAANRKASRGRHARSGFGQAASGAAVDGQRVSRRASHQSRFGRRRRHRHHRTLRRQRVGAWHPHARIRLGRGRL